MGLRDNDLCHRCQQRESLTHLLLECPHTKLFWRALEQWMCDNIERNIALSVTDICFGKQEAEYSLINYLLLLAKQYLYTTRLSETDLSILAIVNTFKNAFKIDRLLAKVNMQNDKFVRKWAPLYNLFNNEPV